MFKERYACNKEQSYILANVLVLLSFQYKPIPITTARKEYIATLYGKVSIH